MNRMDWVLVRRLLGSIGLTLLIMYGLVLLVESLSTSRFSALMRLGGPGVAVLAIAIVVSVLDYASAAIRERYT